METDPDVELIVLEGPSYFLTLLKWRITMFRIWSTTLGPDQDDFLLDLASTLAQVEFDARWILEIEAKTARA